MKTLLCRSSLVLVLLGMLGGFTMTKAADPATELSEPLRALKPLVGKWICNSDDGSGGSVKVLIEFKVAAGGSVITTDCEVQVNDTAIDRWHALIHWASDTRKITQQTSGSSGYGTSTVRVTGNDVVWQGREVKNDGTKEESTSKAVVQGDRFTWSEVSKLVDGKAADSLIENLEFKRVK